MPCLHKALDAGFEAGPGTPAVQGNGHWITAFNQYFSSFPQQLHESLIFESIGSFSPFSVLCIGTAHAN